MDFSYIKDNALWMVEIIVGLCVIWLAHSLIASSIRKVSKKAKDLFPLSLSGKVDVILLPPIKVLSFTIAGYYMLSVLVERLAAFSFASSAKPFLHATVVICMAWIAMRWKKQLLLGIKQHPKMMSFGMGHTIDKILSMLIFILSVLVILQVFKVDIWPLLAFGGIGAAAVGFAAKDVISNFCGGLMLSITRPFLIGEQILLPSLSVEGPVEEIGWYLTVIRDKDRRAVYLPNAIFSSALVINVARMTHRRILEQISFRFSDFDKVPSTLEKMRKYLIFHESVDSSTEPLVHLHNFKEASLGIYLDVYVVKTQLHEYLAVKEDILTGIYKIIDSEGVKIPSTTFAIEMIPPS